MDTGKNILKINLSQADTSLQVGKPLDVTFFLSGHRVGGGEGSRGLEQFKREVKSSFRLK